MILAAAIGLGLFMAGLASKRVRALGMSAFNLVMRRSKPAR
jgi:hypothetical protein